MPDSLRVPHLPPLSYSPLFTPHHPHSPTFATTRYSISLAATRPHSPLLNLTRPTRHHSPLLNLTRHRSPPFATPPSSSTLSTRPTPSACGRRRLLMPLAMREYVCVCVCVCVFVCVYVDEGVCMCMYVFHHSFSVSTTLTTLLPICIHPSMLTVRSRTLHP